MPEGGAMKTVKLGDRGPEVTELALGTLTMSSIQADIGVDAGAEVICAAVRAGITFVDTAVRYDTHPHVREALSRLGDPAGVVLATKSPSRTADDMKREIETTCEELGRDRIDIYLMHLIHPGGDWAEREGAFRELCRARDAGRVGCVGISSHTVAALDCAMGNDDIDVVHSCVNQKGFGITDGSLDDLRRALGQLKSEGKGVYAMKPLGGGHLRKTAREALNFVRGLDEVDAVAVGMKSAREVTANVAIFSDRPVTAEMLDGLGGVERRLMINRLCIGCGKCVERCDQGALSLVDGKSEVDRDKCIICGYCVEACPVFAIRVI